MDTQMQSHSSSSSQPVIAAPKELLAVLNILNEKQKIKYKQQRKGQETQQQQNQQYQHLHHHYQQPSHREQHKQQQLVECCKWEGEQGQSLSLSLSQSQLQPQQHMELSQIELIYLAEGNANLVLALPQFKKVLRLPKISQQQEQKQLKQKAQNQEVQRNQKNSQQQEQPQGQLKQQDDEINQKEPKQKNILVTAGQQENNNDAVGILTMDHYVAYISIIRCLVGNEFVFEADVVAVPNPNDRHWINEHIKPYRPANRLDKEFRGHFGLLLPDATQLPAEFDILFSKIQSATVTIATETEHCSNNRRSSNSSNTDNSCSLSNNIFGSDTFAIEIKPKQGWLLPNDVNNLFDIKPKIEQITKTTQPPCLRETKKVELKATVATTISKEMDEKALKSSTDIESFTAIQSEPSQTTSPPTPATSATRARATTTSQTEVTMTGSSRCWGGGGMSSTIQGDDKISHSLYDRVDTRCRYCCMQFLKMKQQKIVKRNQYCPMDLFSGSHEKMLFALQNLFECPQNNLRIFKNGKLVFDDQISRTFKIEDFFSTDKLQLIKHLLVICLLREYDNTGEAKDNKAEEQISKGTEKQLLSSSASISATRVGGQSGGGVSADDGSRAGVTTGQPQSSATSCKKQKLNTMPKTIPATSTTTWTTRTETEVTKVKSTLTSTEPIFAMGSMLASTTDSDSTRCLEQINKAEMTCLPKNCVLQKVLHLQSLAKINLQFMLDHGYADENEKTYKIVCKLLDKFTEAQNELSLSQLSPEEQYILAATALDCSIMITFCEIENILERETQWAVGGCLNDRPFVVSIFDKTYLTKVTLLDLDPKTDAHFSKYCLQTKQIFAALNEL